MGVELRLLGSVEARVDNQVLDIGHARQRCVLSVLMVEANRAVPADRLVERVWSAGTPRHARTALSGYLSRLRRVVEPAPEVQIARRPGGYALTVEPMAVDLHRFRTLVGHAHVAGTDERAAAYYTEALGLWQGEPFANLDTPWINGVRATLEEERRTAELDRNDAELRCSRHARLLPQLSAQASARPLDERLAGQLMVAFYRCGRQAEALASYQQLRARLADELGADPGLPLRRLHEQVLRSDELLAAPTALRGPARPHRAGFPPPRGHTRCCRTARARWS